MPPIPASKLTALALSRRKLFEKIMQHVATRKIQNHMQATGDRMSATPQQFGMQIGKTMGKQAFVTLPATAGLGAGIGAITSPSGHRMEGAGRGAVKGTGTTGAVGGAGLGYAGASAAIGKPSWENKEAGAGSSLLKSLQKVLGKATKTLASDDVFYPAVAGTVGAGGALAGSEAYRALTAPKEKSAPTRPAISPQPNKRILGNPAFNGDTNGNQFLGMPVFAPKGTQINIGPRKVTEPRRSIFNNGNIEGNQFMGIPLALPQGLQFNIGPRKQASLLSTLGGVAGGGIGGLAGGAGGGIMGALAGGALGGGPGAGIGLLAGGAAGLGAGAHLGSNIGSSIGKKKKKPESDEKEEKSEEKSEDSGDEEVKKSAAAVLEQLQKNAADPALKAYSSVSTGQTQGGAPPGAYSGKISVPVAPPDKQVKPWSNKHMAGNSPTVTPAQAEAANRNAGNTPAASTNFNVTPKRILVPAADEVAGTEHVQTMATRPSAAKMYPRAKQMPPGTGLTDALFIGGSLLSGRGMPQRMPDRQLPYGK